MSLPNPIRKPLLCYVTDRHAVCPSSENSQQQLLEKIETAARAGIDWIQIREKDLSGRELSTLATRAAQRASPRTRILVNDRLDIAWANGAAGVHLGEQGISVAEAVRFCKERNVQREFLVGASVHSLEAALAAERDGASYIVFGPIFATPSKAAYGKPCGPERLAEVCGRISIPVLAIGGITLENAGSCLQAGAHGIAAIRLFQDAQDLPRLMEKLRGL